MKYLARGMLASAVLLCAGLAAAEAQASNRPAAACRPMAHLPGELWLGHFTGGRRIEAGRAFDWRDEYACFTSRAQCTAWRNGLRRVYRHAEGHGTCMALRGGGRVVKTVVVRQAPLRARY